LQATIVGVVLLHLLLIPGVAFITGGARVWEQDLHPQVTQLNHTLLTIGVMTLLLPAAFFSTLDRGLSQGEEGTLVNDTTRRTFLQISRGLSVILLLVYVASRIFLHNPFGEDNALHLHPNAPEELKDEERRLANTDPEVNQWVLLVMLCGTIAVLATTAEFLVESIEIVRKSGKIKEEWFGMIILPIVSFSADGTIAVAFFIRSRLTRMDIPVTTLAKAQAIDLSIQFTLFWMPLVVILGWWTSKSMTLLFGMLEYCLPLRAP
jgi:Ca2+:H+ antiporter